MDIESGIRQRNINRDDHDPLRRSQDDLSLFRTRYDTRMSDENRMELILNELSLFRKEVETKSIETQCRANWYRIINGGISLGILLFSAIIIGIQAASECINYYNIALASLIFAMEGTHKIFRWGPQGVFYKYNTILLKKILWQARDYMYMFNNYTPEQLLAVISQLRTQFDDIDVGLYRTSMAGVARFNTGFDVDTGGNILPQTTSMGNTPIGQNTPDNKNSNSHVHIHINNSPASRELPEIPSAYMPERNNSDPILIVSGSPVVNENNKPTKTPSTPRRIHQSNTYQDDVAINIPTIDISSDSVYESPVSVTIPESILKNKK
jgi:hypothetical protein